MASDIDYLMAIMQGMGILPEEETAGGTAGGTGGSSESWSPDVSGMMGGGTSGGLAGFDVALQGIQQGLGTLADIYEMQNKEEYEQKKLAWQREAERIARENQARTERVKSRNEIINQMGGGWSSRSPKLLKQYGGMLPYSPDPTAEYLKTGQTIVKGIQSNLKGGSSGLQQIGSAISPTNTPTDTGSTWSWGAPRSTVTGTPQGSGPSYSYGY